MIFITDELGKFEKNIIELAENMGFKECKTIEAIDLFCGISEKNDVLKEKDRYYAFIDIPQYWSVRADGLNGAIYDNKTKKANIYFKNPIEKRMVSRVEWIDRNNTVYRIDYYNKYGYMYCSENVSGGNVTVREFYDRNGDIKVLEQTGPKTYTTFGTRISPKSYRGFADYLEAYLKYNKIYDENIWLTSDEILNKFAWDYGNFKISYLPQNRLNSDLTVITQTNTAFRILCSEEQQVNWYKENSNYKCDRLYSYLENNKSKFGRKEAFIITESDQLEYIEQLINDFPEITFHIAASTIMSDKLTRLDINNNVELYPCITEQKRKELFERCDIYLDINHYRELYNAVNEAKGGDEAKLKGLIGRLDCADYVHLMGQQKLDDVYKHYDAYVAASQSEGFGLTLMEAIGSGLPIVGFDVRYGNQTFIDDGQNGYKIPITDEMDQKEKIKLLSERIVRMFTEDDMDAFSGHSYEKAKEYLTKEVVHRWIELLK